jgi:glycosyltransferase involved in cell wall biosynthesis
MNISVSNSTLAIAIVSNATSGGGAEKSMMALHEEFLRLGLESNFVALNRNLPINVVPKVTILNRKWKSGVRSTINNYFEFKKTIRNIDPKILILNCELPELFGSLINFKGKVICVEHTTFPWYKKRYLGRIVRLMLRFKKVQWVTVIKDSKKIWFGKNAIMYIPNPYVPPLKTNKVSVQPPFLVFIGGIKKNKRPEWVIEAGIKSDLEVHIYGSGPLKIALEEKYKNLKSNVKFYGFQLGIWENLPINALVVIPSEFEGDGMVVMEAILSGSPVALANNQDLKRFQLDEKHYFKDTNELYEIIKNFKRNNFKELIPSDSFKADLMFARSLNIIAEKWLELLTETDYNKITK